MQRGSPLCSFHEKCQVSLWGRLDPHGPLESQKQNKLARKSWKFISSGIAQPVMQAYIYIWVARVDCRPSGALLAAKWEKHGKTCGECEKSLVPHRPAQRRWLEAKARLSGLTAFTPLSFLFNWVFCIWASLDLVGAILELGHFLKSCYGTKNWQVPAQPDVRMQSYNIWFQVTSSRMPFGQTLDASFRGNS